MANATQTSENAATAAPTFETIIVRHNASTTLEDVPALKSSLEHSTITAARVLALGYEVDSNDVDAKVVLPWRSPKLMKPWKDSFLIVKEATMKDGVAYDIVLSSEITDRLLLVRSGGLIALAKSRVQAEREREKKEDEEVERRLKKELKEEDRKRRERLQKAMASKQAAVATAS